MRSAPPAPLKDPAHPGVAAILGISGQVMQAHYNRADKAKAAQRFHASLREDRKQTQSLARRAFSKQRRKKRTGNDRTVT
jgi:hypothetical protein